MTNLDTITEKSSTPIKLYLRTHGFVAAVIQKMSSSSKKKLFFYTLFIIFCVILMISRRPGSIFHARFYAEDGQAWYADAYNYSFLSNIFRPDSGFSAFTRPNSGYLLTFQRLLAQIDVLFPLRFAPLFFNICAVAVQTLPLFYILSSRMEVLLPKQWQRVILCVVYVALPNSFEVSLILTNSNWRLALLAIFIVIARRPVTKWQIIADIAIFVTTCLTGPFAIFLLPFIFAKYLTERNKYRLSLLMTSVACSILQMYFIRNSHTKIFARGVLYAAKEIIYVFTGQVIMGSLIGMHNYSYLFRGIWFTLPSLRSASLVLGAIIFGWILIKSNFAMRIMILYGTLIMLGGIISIRPGETTGMILMIFPGTSVRYEFILIFSLFTGLLWIVFVGKNDIMRMLAILLLFVAAFVAVPSDWVFPQIHGYHFYHYVNIFNKARKGTVVKIPIYPNSWKMILIKH